MKKTMRAKRIILSLVICLSYVFTLSGCGKEKEDEGYQKNKSLNTSEKVTLRIASNQQTWPEMDNVIAKFEKIYPNCTVVCEYIEEFNSNIGTRLAQDENKIDIFKTLNIQESTEYKDYTLNLISEESKKTLKLTDTNSGLVDNFKYTSAEDTQYAIPYGGEMRGMYVNSTLLKKLNLKVPTNRAELLNCCEVLKKAGYIPIQSDVATFAQQFMYPYICNSIVNGGKYSEMYKAIENIEPGISEYFRDAYAFLYDIVEKDYFNYKKVTEELGYTFDGKDGKARDFLNVVKVSGDEYKKQDDVGKIAFMIDTQSFGLNLSKTKSDYHSEIEYEFIVSPVGQDGGYAYLSPADGLAVNNKSDHIDWSLEFLNFFFTHDVNKEFAKQSGKIPNTSDALVEYNIPSNRTSDVGQVTFSYGFYKVVTTPMLGGYDDMVSISKMNAKKYMKDNGDGTYSIAFTLDDYIARLEEEFKKIKESR